MSNKVQYFEGLWIPKHKPRLCFHTDCTLPLKLYMQTLYNFSYLAWFSKYSVDQKLCAVRHLGIIIDLINWVFGDVTSRVNLLKFLHVGLNFFEKFLKMLWVNWVLVTYAYRMHIQDGGMHAFRKPSKIRNNCKESLYIILNVLLNKINLIYIAISL
jgi:hypothetical protein